MRVLLTGGTGSLGQALIPLLLARGDVPVVFSRNEYLQWDVKQRFPKALYVLGDVRDPIVCEGIDAIIHTAALKHVPTGETQPMECVLTNVQGADNVITAALSSGVEKVIAISTDKAVHPVNVYGATKFIMEKLFLHAGFSVVRLGNFWESHGNVVELFRKQSQTGMITVTDERMKRFFIKTEDAAKFTLKCLDEMKGGEIFVPRMRLYSLKEIAGLVAPDSVIIPSGVRAGEKMQEELFNQIEEPVDCDGYWKLAMV